MQFIAIITLDAIDLLMEKGIERDREEEKKYKRDKTRAFIQ